MNKDISKLEDSPKSEKMGHGWLRNPRKEYRRRYPYSLIKKFLYSRLGKPISEVFSAWLALNWLPEEKKNYKDFSREVMVNTFMRDGKVWFNSDYPFRNKSDCEIEQQRSITYYAHPETLKLCCWNPPRINYEKKRRLEEAKTFRVLEDWHHLYKLNGVWYEIKYSSQIPDDIIQFNGLYYKRVWRFLENRQCIKINNQFYIPVPKFKPIIVGPQERLFTPKKESKFEFYKDFSSPICIILWRELNSKDLKQHGLKNDINLVFEKCQICGGINCKRRHK